MRVVVRGYDGVRERHRAALAAHLCRSLGELLRRDEPGADIGVHNAVPGVHVDSGNVRVPAQTTFDELGTPAAAHFAKRDAQRLYVMCLWAGG
jgi:hypothetical protein